MWTTSPVLIVESNLDICQLLTTCLTLEGHHVVLFDEERDVIEWMTQATEPCDVILLDLGISPAASAAMLDELQACCLRSFAPPPTIIGLTTSWELFRAFSHPALSHILAKPFHLKQLRELVESGKRQHDCFRNSSFGGLLYSGFGRQREASVQGR